MKKQSLLTKKKFSHVFTADSMNIEFPPFSPATMPLFGIQNSSACFVTDRYCFGNIGKCSVSRSDTSSLPFCVFDEGAVGKRFTSQRSTQIGTRRALRLLKSSGICIFCLYRGRHHIAVCEFITNLVWKTRALEHLAGAEANNNGGRSFFYYFFAPFRPKRRYISRKKSKIFDDRSFLRLEASICSRYMLKFRQKIID